MSENIIHLRTEAELKSLIEKETRAVIIDCYADFCGPCKAIAPFIDKLANSEVGYYVCFAKVNVEEAPELANTLNIVAMPTFIAYKDGQQVYQFTGGSKDKLIELIKSITT